MGGEHRECNARALLADPSLDLAITSFSKTPEQYAREYGELTVEAEIAHEVSGDLKGKRCLSSRWTGREREGLRCCLGTAC